MGLRRFFAPRESSSVGANDPFVTLRCGVVDLKPAGSLTGWAAFFKARGVPALVAIGAPHHRPVDRGKSRLHHVCKLNDPEV